MKTQEVSSFPYAVFPYVFPLQIQHILDKILHSNSAVLGHAFGEMPIAVQSKGGGGMAKVALYGFDIITGPDGVYGVCMPLWHNKDKSENPCGATG